MDDDINNDMLDDYINDQMDEPNFDDDQYYEEAELATQAVEITNSNNSRINTTTPEQGYNMDVDVDEMEEKANMTANSITPSRRITSTEDRNTIAETAHVSLPTTTREISENIYSFER
jgi:hypothetical protein